MTSLLLNSAGDPVSATSLADRVIKAGGLIGLIAVGVTTFLMFAFWGGQRELAAAQDRTHAAVSQHIADSQADRQVQRQLAYAQCLMLAKLSKSDASLCEVGR